LFNFTKPNSSIFTKSISHNFSAAKRSFGTTRLGLQRPNWYQGSGKSRGFFDNITPTQAIYGIIGANALVFAGWQYAVNSFEQFRDVKALQFMQQNFTVSWGNVVTGKRWWTVLTCGYSHSDFMHFGINMFVLYSFGRTLANSMGVARFLGFYHAALVFSSLASLAYNRYYVPRYAKSQMKRVAAQKASSHGASGAITAMTVLYAMVAPTATVLLFGIVPLPAWLAIGSFVGYDAYRSIQMGGGKVDAAGHLGGALYGALFYAMRIRR
jgi:membrane associated rhomboid family serine protease